jgi:HK97 family phage major capsid protein
LRKANRPGAAWESKDDNAFERKEAIGLCHNRRALTVPKIDAGVADNYVPSSSEVDEALIHRKAMKALLRHGDATRLEPTFQKSLSAFSFGATGFLLAPEMSNQVLRCIVDPTDVSGLVNRVNSSAPSIRFPIDNARMLIGGWACEASCFANNPQPDLAEGSASLKLKPKV